MMFRGGLRLPVERDGIDDLSSSAYERESALEKRTFSAEAVQAPCDADRHRPQG
jgi:hypothetical protein